MGSDAHDKKQSNRSPKPVRKEKDADREFSKSSGLGLVMQRMSPVT